MAANTETFDNINFQILLKQHGGNMNRALYAWRRICELGRYGDIPHTYEGGLDLKGIRIRLDEESQKEITGVIYHPITKQPLLVEDRASTDDAKRIEDIAAGDDPHRV